MPLPERPLGEAIRPASGSVVVDTDQEYRIAGIYSFGRGFIKRPTIRGTETSYKTLTRLDVDQLVMSKLNAWEGALAVVPQEFSEAHVSPEYPVFEINKDVAEPGYIAHLVKWPTLWERLTPRGSMVRRKRTTPSTLMATMVPLPDLDEQRRIATYLDSSFDKLQKIEILYNNRPRLSTALRDSTIEQAIARSTTSLRMESIVVASRIPIDIDPNRSYRALGMRSFGKGAIRYPAVKGNELSKLRYFRFTSGALVLSNIKAWEGAIGITSEEDANCVASNRFLFYSARDNRVNLSYLKYYLLSRRGLAQISSCSPGSADRNRTLSIKKFENLTVPLPARKEQDRLARTLDTLDSHIDTSETKEMKEALQVSLLNAAFSGQL